MRSALLILIGLSGISMTANAQSTGSSEKDSKKLAHEVVKYGGQRFQLKLEDAKRRLIQSLIGIIRAYKPASCDPALPLCKSAAEALANKEAADYAAVINAAFEEGYAALFESQMSPAEIAAAKSFTESVAGARFTATLASGEMPPLLVISYVSRRAKDFEDGLYDRFLRETRSLPRRILRVPPPPGIRPRDQ